MADDNTLVTDDKILEIYKQRYATFRHLDRLRWQLLQISVGVISLALVFTANSSVSPAWWALSGLGVMFIIFGLVMERIRLGLNKNNEVLRNVAIQIGDKDIPTISEPWRSIACWIAWIWIIGGATCIIISICTLTR